MSEKVAVVMAGGRGTRFWPRSRGHRPKQFLEMVGEGTLLNQTVARLGSDFPPERVYVVTTADLATEACRLLPQLPPENIIVEPQGRNTAPCLALALVTLEARHPGAVMVVLAADHWITAPDLFLEDLDRAARHAVSTHDLVTFGIRPAYPETGYGYIETQGEGEIRKVQAFREKPPLATAVEYVQSGRHFWNSGMFVWTLADMRKELLEHSPDTLKPLDAWVAAGRDRATLAEAYGRLPKTSIDYALMEKSHHVAVVPARFGWSDVGSWPAVVDFHTPDAEGNVVVGDAVLVNSANCAIFGGKRLVAGSGLSDLIVVDEDDALLICRRDKAQGVKDIVERLQKQGRTDLL